MLSDLRESGAIEQDADIVSFIYRPEYYGFLQDEDGNSNAGIGEIIIAKHRNGALDSVRLRFIKEYARFENIESNFDAPGMSGGPAAPAAISNESITAKNSNFDQESGTYTIPSKMNSLDEENEDFDPSEGGEAPF